MKRIVVWSWRYVLVSSAFFIFLLSWCGFAYRHGYAKELSFWLFFPLIILFFVLVIVIQFSVIEINGPRLLVSHFGGFRKRSFNRNQISLSFGIKVKPGAKALSLYPIDIYDNTSNKRYRINCGSIRGAAFETFWKTYQ